MNDGLHYELAEELLRRVGATGNRGERVEMLLTANAHATLAAAEATNPRLVALWDEALGARQAIDQAAEEDGQ